jgi:hypothetical protein
MSARGGDGLARSAERLALVFAHGAGRAEAAAGADGIVGWSYGGVAAAMLHRSRRSARSCSSSPRSTSSRASRRARAHGARRRHPVDPAALARTRTLVLTGGWSDEYEEVAAALVELGAKHEVLAGHGHAVADHPGCAERIRAFVGG